MTDKTPLVSDPKRQAIQSIRGYDYQILRSVEAWLQLKDGDTLYLEGAEDFDVVTEKNTTAIQVKNSTSPITLNSVDTKKAIQNFIFLKKKNMKRKIEFNFLSRGQAATEKTPITKGKNGIELWSLAAKGDLDCADMLKKHLLQQSMEGCDSFLNQSPQDLIKELFSVFHWILGEDDEDLIIKGIERRLVKYGQGQKRSPSTSLKARAALRSYCLDTVKQPNIQQRSLTIEDFYCVFDEATSVRVPLDSINQPLTPLPPPFILDIPEISITCIQRNELVDNVFASLETKELVILAASVGMGKTTIAQLVGNKCIGQCIWLGLAGKDQHSSAEAFLETTLFVEDNERVSTLIIDDFLIERQLLKETWDAFQVLMRASRKKSISILVTTRGLEKEDLDIRLRDVTAEVIRIPPLTQGEIRELFIEMGSPQDSRLNAWSQQTLLTTSGHPKLSYVKALDLKDAGWPLFKAENLLDPSEGIDAQRLLARLDLDNFLPIPEKDLLYTLSLVIPVFHREFVLNLGLMIPQLSDPGSAFDRLLGRWIDHISQKRYRITALLSGEGQKVWPPSKVKEAHGIIFDSFLNSSSIDAVSVEGIFLHAILSKDILRINHILYKIISSKEDQFLLLCQHLHFLVFWNKGAIANEFGAEINMLFHLLQYKVAVKKAPSELHRIAVEWVEESKSKMDNRGVYLRFIMYFTIASTIEVPLHPQIILNSLLNILKLHPLIESDDSLLFPSSPLTRKGIKEDMSHTIAGIFALFSSKCTSLEYFTSLLDSIESLDMEERCSLFAAHKDGYFEEAFYYITQTTWLNEEKNSVDPQKLIDVFLRAIRLGDNWGLSSLSIMSARIIAIIYDEYINDIEQALETIEDACSRYRNHDVLLSQLANIYFRDDKLQKSLEIWGAILLKEGNPNKLLEPYLYRHAGVASARLGNYSLAADFFEAGAGHEAIFPLDYMQCGFWVDAAYVAYIGNDYARSIKNFASAALLLSSQRNNSEFKWKAQRKLAGHVVLWINRQVDGRWNDLAKPPFGICSDGSPHEGLQDLHDTPALLTILFIMILEDHLTGEAEIYSKFKYIFYTQETRPFQFFYTNLAIKKVFRAFDFYSFPELLLRWKHASLETSDMLADSVHLPQDERSDMKPCVDVPIRCALNAAIALWGMHGKAVEDLFVSWKLSKIDDAEVRQAIKEVEGYWQSMSAQAATILIKDHGKPAYQRQTAAAYILSHNDTLPDTSVFAQTGLFLFFNAVVTRDWIAPCLPFILERYSQMWKRHLKEPALLRYPKLSVSEIESALALPEPSIEKLIKILDVGSYAARVNLFDGWRDSLRQVLV